jgi:uncharacterized protein (TIGR00269 family)
MRRGETIFCSKCGKGKAIIKRRYSGERLCNKCFIESIERKVKKTIIKYTMFNHEDKIGVALSGGKDSVSLLHILSKIEKRFPRSRIVALTIDEGIEGYRKEAIEISKECCKILGIDQTISSFEEIYGHSLDEIVEATQQRKSDLSTCAFCGILRRKALNILAREEGMDRLATAHNLDDEAQTILLNIVNGDRDRLVRTKPKLDGIHRKFVQRVKPLCYILEREVTLYAYLTGIRFQEAVCPYRETSMRQEIREILNTLETSHPGIKYNLPRLFESIGSRMKEETNMSIQECIECGEPSSQSLCKTCVELSGLETFLRQREAYIRS